MNRSARSASELVCHIETSDVATGVAAPASPVGASDISSEASRLASTVTAPSSASATTRH